MKRYLTIDVGASSGRHILGYVEDGRIVLEEIYRFENKLIERGGHLCWDVDALFGHVVAGLKACRDAGKIPVTLGIDTWGVDFMLLGKDRQRIGDVVAYRDGRTANAVPAITAAISPTDLYAKTGIQHQPFNTIYQIRALQNEHPEDLEQAESLLMMPDYLGFLLTGVKRQEYTNATTTALVNAENKIWDYELIDKLGYPKRLFGGLSLPGTTVGNLKPEIAKEIGFDCTVVLPATHDTGSAFLAVPKQDESAVTISSGTWSLLGVELEEPITSEVARAANFTNEGGYGYRYRLLKNIMGLWMLQSIRREQGDDISFAELEQQARAASGFKAVVDVLDNRFLAPENMIEEVKATCIENAQPAPESIGEVAQCVYQSLAKCYAQTIRQLEDITRKRYSSINIVGGGCKDSYLNQLTADATGLPVYAGPTEGTALGNLMVQMIAAGEFTDLASARAAIPDSFEVNEYIPGGMI